MFCCRRPLMRQGDFLVKVHLAGTLLLLAGLITPTPALSDTWRDTVREQAQYFDHSDYPDYERPDKTDFLLQYENFYGLHDTSVLVVKFANELDPARVKWALEYLMGDVDGDGIADLFVRRPSTLRWFLSKHVSGWL